MIHLLGMTLALLAITGGGSAIPHLPWCTRRHDDDQSCRASTRALTLLLNARDALRFKIVRIEQEMGDATAQMRRLEAIYAEANADFDNIQDAVRDLGYDFEPDGDLDVNDMRHNLRAQNCHYANTIEQDQICQPCARRALLEFGGTSERGPTSGEATHDRRRPAEAVPERSRRPEPHLAQVRDD